MSRKVMLEVPIQEEDALRILGREMVRYRIAFRDGNYSPATRDHDEDRVNLKIEDGVVFDAYLG